MSSIWLFIFALAICSLAHADDYDYNELVSEEPIQVSFNKIDLLLFLQANQNITMSFVYSLFILQTVTETI